MQGCCWTGRITSKLQIFFSTVGQQLFDYLTTESKGCFSLPLKPCVLKAHPLAWCYWEVVETEEGPGYEVNSFSFHVLPYDVEQHPKFKGKVD